MCQCMHAQRKVTGRGYAGAAGGKPCANYEGSLIVTGIRVIALTVRRTQCLQNDAYRPASVTGMDKPSILAESPGTWLERPKPRLSM